MTLHDDISASVIRGETLPDCELTLLFRTVKDEFENYVVAECLEIPGCVSQGASQEEAEQNIKDAIEACLMVMYMDSFRRLTECRSNRDLCGISSQRRLTIIQPQPELVFA